MSYANEKETVLTNDTFEDWAKHCNGNRAAMKKGVVSEDGPFFHLNEATGAKYELTGYEFCYDPMKLDITADEIIDGKRYDDVKEPNKTATARYFCKDGHTIIEHCEIG